MSLSPISGCPEGVRSHRTCNVQNAARLVRLIPDANVDPCAVAGLEICSNTTGNRINILTMPVYFSAYMSYLTAVPTRSPTPTACSPVSQTYLESPVSNNGAIRSDAPAFVVWPMPL